MTKIINSLLVNKLIAAMLIVGTSVALVGCGADEQSVDLENWAGSAYSPSANLYFSYPINGQQEVMPKTPIVLSFLSKVDTDNAQFSLQSQTEGASKTIALRIRNTADKGNSLVLEPEEALAENTTYQVQMQGVQSQFGLASLPAGGIQFTTRPALTGPFSLVSSSNDFKLNSIYPEKSPSGQPLPLVDFSTFSLNFSQALNAQSAKHNIKLTQNGQAIEATLLVKDRFVTIDPKAELAPNQPLSLVIEAELENQHGTKLGQKVERTFIPQDTKPRSLMVQKAPEANNCERPSAEFISKYTGDAVNCIPVIAKLLGNETVSKQSGDMFIELGFAPNFAEATPLRIKKKQLLQGGALEVNIGGHVPAGFDSGAVSISFISDAVGYLLENPYTSHASAARLLILNMDVAMVTADPRAGGAFTQDLLHVSLVGTAKANKSGQLVADAIGIVEPSVLGAENGYGMLNFHMEAYADAENLPSQAIDTTAPKLMSWVPGVVGQAVPQYAGDEPTVELGDNNNVATLIQPQDPIILNFNKPLDIHSVSEDSLKIWRDSQPEEFTWYQDGTALVIKPKQPLQYGSSYRLDLSSQITDLSGNAVAEQTLAFTMPTYESSNAIPTVILSAYPGFPCATKNATFGQDNGRCLGGKEGDDLLPIPSMPANRMINLIFSQPVNAETAVLGTTFEVEQCESTTNCASPVPVTGELKVRGSSLTFIPTQPWQDAALYRYRIKTASADSDAACQAKTALCALSAGESRPVVTAFLQPNAITNNPELEVYFTGAKATESVQQILRNLPSTDIDANFKIEASEAGLLTGKNTVQLEAHTPEKLIEFVKVGCDEQDHCPDDQIIHVTGALGADILGYDSTQKAVKVAVYPTQIFTSSATLYIRYEYDEDYSSPPEARTDTIETNAQLMRIRYAKDAEGKRTQPAIGWIKEKDGKAFMEVTLELYLDAPQLQLELLGASQSHDLHSRALELTLSGPVEFLADGRLQIQQQSTDKISIKVITTQTNGTTTATAAKMTLDIPEGGINMNYVTEPVKQ